MKVTEVSPQVDFGVRLRAAREARGVSLRDIAATTKISMTALEGLEHGDASRLPGGIFSRSFVRAYASEVGLDPEATVREFLERFPDAVQPLRAPVVATMATEGSGGRRWLQVTMATVVLLIAAGTGLALSGSAWVPAFVTEVEPPPPIVGAPPDVPTPAPPSAPSADDVAASSGGAAVSPASGPEAKRDGSVGVTSALAVPDQSDALRLVMEPVAPCWVKVVADGAVVFAREMNAGEREVRQAQGEIVLTVGDAGAFTYTINDIRGRPLGSKGKVVTIRIHRANLTDFVAN